MKPTISPDTALDQAGMTLKTYLFRAEKEIDNVFGKGFARENPELVAAAINMQARDYDSYSTSVAIYDAAEKVASIADAVDQLRRDVNKL